MTAGFAIDKALDIGQKGNEFLVVSCIKIKSIRLKPVLQPAPWIVFAALCQQFPVGLCVSDTRKRHHLHWPEKHFAEMANSMI